jgi:ribosomal protein S18 acetylase RimI-like enzyme
MRVCGHGALGTGGALAAGSMWIHALRAAPRLCVRAAVDEDAMTIELMLSDQLRRQGARPRFPARVRVATEHLLVAELDLGPNGYLVVGAIAVTVERLAHCAAHHALVTALVIDRRFSRRRVARALWVGAEDLARREGCDAVFVVNRTDHRVRARALYRSVGFELAPLAFTRTN